MASFIPDRRARLNHSHLAATTTRWLWMITGSVFPDVERSTKHISEYCWESRSLEHPLTSALSSGAGPVEEVWQGSWEICCVSVSTSTADKSDVSRRLSKTTASFKSCRLTNLHTRSSGGLSALFNASSLLTPQATRERMKSTVSLYFHHSNALPVLVFRIWSFLAALSPSSANSFRYINILSTRFLTLNSWNSSLLSFDFVMRSFAIFKMARNFFISFPRFMNNSSFMSFWTGLTALSFEERISSIGAMFSLKRSHKCSSSGMKYCTASVFCSSERVFHFAKTTARSLSTASTEGDSWSFT